MRTSFSAKWFRRIWPSKRPTGWRFWWLPCWWFSRALLAPFTFFAEGSAAAVSRWIGLRGGHGGGGHSAEELKFIVSSSRREGHLHRFEEDAIQALLELSDYYAREIMVPRNAIVSVSVDASLDQVLRRMREHEYSRLPVYDASPEHIIGYVHYKDMMRIWEERRIANSKRRPLPPFHLSRVLRKPLVVPETKPLNDLIDEFRETHIHMAIVVDEFGTIAGLVTLEDALEQIFGEIGDEHDVKRPRPTTEAPAWKWMAPSRSAIWTRNMAWSCPATPVLKRWPASCSSSWATFPSRAMRWNTGGANSPFWPWITIASSRVRIERLPDAAAESRRLRRPDKRKIK